MGSTPLEPTWRRVAYATAPAWAALIFSRVLFYGLERLRFPELVPPVWADAVQGTALWPCVVAGCYLTLRTWRRAGIASAVAVAAGSALGVGVLAGPAYGLGALLSSGWAAFHGWLTLIQRSGPNTWYLWLSVIVEFGALYLSAVAAVVGFLSVRTLMQERVTRLSAEAMAAQNRLRALRAQLNPHFLFNALNSIASLDDTEPRAARQLVMQLSDLLRRTLGASECEEHPLSDELAYVETYLQIQQIRLPSRLRWRIRADPRCLVAQVPSLILLPLVENSVVHGQRGGVHVVEIDIDVACPHDYVIMTVSNTCHPSAIAHPRLGLGLRNVRERLEVLYGRDAMLCTEFLTTNRFKAVIRLPAPHSPPHVRESRESPCVS